MKINSTSAAKTKKIAETLAKEICGVSFPHAFVVALRGELGAGKTTFAQGFMRGLGVHQKVQSPTFVLFKKFVIPKNKKTTFRHVIHADAYRLASVRDLRTLGFHDEITDPKNIILIEWPERVRGILPKNYLFITISHGKKRERKLTFEAK